MPNHLIQGFVWRWRLQRSAMHKCALTQIDADWTLYWALIGRHFGNLLILN